MYLNVTGNTFAVCQIVSKPQFVEEYGEYKKDLTKVSARCKETSAEGTQTVNLSLYFWDGLAIPAMKISVGMSIWVAGREKTMSYTKNGKNVLERSLFVEGWGARETDPLGMLVELQARREAKVNEETLRLTFLELLTQAKPAILQWIADWIKEHISLILEWLKGKSHSGGNEAESEKKDGK